MLRGCIEIDTHRVHAAHHYRVEALLQLTLVHIMLILPHSDALGIDLHQLSQRVHQSSADRNRSTHRHILIRKLLTGNLRGGIDRGSILTYHIDIYRMLKIYLVQPLTGFPACRSVAYRHGLYLILAHHTLHGSSGLHTLAAGRMRIDDLMMHKIALGVKTCSLASIGKAWVDSHDTLLSKRSCQEQLTQVLCKDNDSLLVGLLLALRSKLSLDTGFQQTLEGIIDSLAYQSLALAKAMNIMTFQFGGASLIIC